MNISSPAGVEKKVFHLPGLNGLRAIAASVVLYVHTAQFSDYLFGLPSIALFRDGTADYSVVLFFTLSGYLITYLLLREKTVFGEIKFKDFYVRRILRIWPVYYITIFATALIILFLPAYLPHQHVAKTFLFYSFFLSNVGYAFGFQFYTLTPLWSVGAEEQFYLFWPLLVDKSKKIIRSLIVFISCFLLIKTGLRFFENSTYYQLISGSAFDAMAIGGIGACIVFNKKTYLKYIYSLAAQRIAWAFFLYSIFVRPIQIASLFDKEIHAIVFAIIIINVSTGKNPIIRLENKIFNFLGKMSYGIYVYHMTIIFLLGLFFNKMNIHLKPGIFSASVIYVSISVSTLAVSTFSYFYFEKYFLKMKERFQKIKTVS